TVTLITNLSRSGRRLACRLRAAGGSPAATAGRTSLLSQQQIERPAAADVPLALATVGEHVWIGAAGILEGIGQDGQVAEVAAVIDLPGHRAEQPAAPAQPGRVRLGRAERVAKDLLKKRRLPLHPGVTGGIPGGQLIGPRLHGE